MSILEKSRQNYLHSQTLLHPHVHLLVTLSDTSFFLFSKTLLFNLSVHSAADPTSQFPPGYFAKQAPHPLCSTRSLFPFSSHSFRYFSPLHALINPLLFLYLHSLTHPTHSKEPLALSLRAMAFCISTQFCLSNIS